MLVSQTIPVGIEFFPLALTVCTEISVKNFRQMVLIFLLAPKTGTGLSCTIFKNTGKFFAFFQHEAWH